MDPLQRKIHFLIDDAAMADERAGLAESVRRAQSNAAASLYINGIGGLIGIGVVGLAAAGTMRDLRARHRAQQALGASEERFRAAFAHAPVGMAMTTATGVFVQANPAFCALTGYGEGELLAMDFRALTHPGDVEESGRAIRRLLEGPDQSLVIEKRYIAKGGGVIWAKTSLSLIPGRGGGEMLVIAQVEDVTERKRAAELLEHQASHDALTGLPNRALLWSPDEGRRSPRPTPAAGRPGGPADRPGPLQGDQRHASATTTATWSSRSWAGRLRRAPASRRTWWPGSAATSSPSSCRGRTGHGRRRRSPGRVLGDLGRADRGGRAPARGRGQHRHRRVSRARPATPRSLLQQADVAMYAAKRARGGHAVYAADQSAVTARDGSRWSPSCARGSRTGQLVLHYQPKVDLRTGARPSGSRPWSAGDHPREGLIPPGLFIPLAEQTGLIRPLGLWALEAALAAMRRVARGRGSTWTVAVNLAAESLHDPQTRRDRRRACWRRRRAPPGG